MLAIYTFRHGRMDDAGSCCAGYSSGMDRRELTQREEDVVRFAAKGHTNPEIAEALGVSIATVKRHLANVMIKWNVRNRTNVALEARDRGIVPRATEEQPTSAPPPTSPKRKQRRAKSRPRTQAKSPSSGRRAQKSKRRKG